MKKNIFSRINNRCKDSKGFTLIELLAVIVVLSIVMLIGVYAVLPQMEGAKRKAFAIEANGVIKAAQQYVAVESLENNTIFTAQQCVDLSTLVTKGYSELDKEGYVGKVMIQKDSTTNVYTYTLTLKNKEYFIANAALKNAKISDDSIKDLGTETETITYSCPTSTKP